MSAATPDRPERLRCRLLVHLPGEGAWNMAVDEALLESADARGALTLRCYGWSEATLSLGYFQPLADRRQHPASAACPLVRRPSGGGAILHDRELTYSIAVPADSALARDRLSLYRALHAALVEALAEHGITARILDAVGRRPASDEPFLCFQRRAVGDVLVGTSKVAGSAQRRRRRAVLQHGSILLERSTFAPELPGIRELAAVHFTAEAMIDLLRERLARSLPLEFVPDDLSVDESAAAESLRARKYASEAWNSRK